MMHGGGSRTRTGDIRLAKPTLYQLSYAPGAGRGRRRPTASFVCGRVRFIFGRRGEQAPPAMCRRVWDPDLKARAQNRRIDHRNSRSLGVRLLRKEVIQPQVPLRLPCYDFIPITTHTLGDSLPCGLGRRLRVQTAFMM